MKKNEITQWIEESLTSDLDNIAALTIRVDGCLKNGSQISQSAWSQSATYSIELVKTALDWTISQLRRAHKKTLKFVACLGGEQSLGVAGHFHALLEYPAGVDKDQFIDRLRKLWARNVAKKLKQSLQTTVYAEPLRDKAEFSRYCQRFEGTTFGSGSSKVVMSKSFSL